MSTQEILSIVALSLLGLCFLCGLAKMAMKKDSDKKNCDKACSMAIFAAVALVGVSQLLTETEKYDPCADGDGAYYCGDTMIACPNTHSPPVGKCPKDQACKCKPRLKGYSTCNRGCDCENDVCTAMAGRGQPCGCEGQDCPPSGQAGQSCQ